MCVISSKKLKPIQADEIPVPTAISIPNDVNNAGGVPSQNMRDEGDSGFVLLLPLAEHGTSHTKEPRE